MLLQGPFCPPIYPPISLLVFSHHRTEPGAQAEVTGEVAKSVCEEQASFELLLHKPGPLEGERGQLGTENPTSKKSP